jgi:hypothetical protein
MDFFIPVLLVSLAAAAVFVFFAFFPIRVTWFYALGRRQKPKSAPQPDAARPHRTKAAKQSPPVYNFSANYRNYRITDEDTYDDAEL